MKRILFATFYLTTSLALADCPALTADAIKVMSETEISGKYCEYSAEFHRLFSTGEAKYATSLLPAVAHDLKKRTEIINEAQEILDASDQCVKQKERLTRYTNLKPGYMKHSCK